MARKKLPLPNTPMAKTKDMPKTETSLVACRFYFWLYLECVARRNLLGKIIF